MFDGGGGGPFGKQITWEGKDESGSITTDI